MLAVDAAVAVAADAVKQLTSVGRSVRSHSMP
jgi:hypothetical protein